jgi:hypothetical protein
MEGNAEKPDSMIGTEISERRRLAFGGTSQLARFFLSRVLASIMASLGCAALVVPSLEGLLARVMRVDACFPRRASGNTVPVLGCLV